MVLHWLQYTTKLARMCYTYIYERFITYKKQSVKSTSLSHDNNISVLKGLGQWTFLTAAGRWTCVLEMYFKAVETAGQ